MPFWKWRGGDEFSLWHAKYSEDAYHAPEESAAQRVCLRTHLVTTIARRRRALQLESVVDLLERRMVKLIASYGDRIKKLEQS
jgi:hypothetical protein